LKRLDESVPRQLGDILIKHGRATLTDPKLCENLLKDYCAPFKEEISLLVLAVKERVASDLLISRDGLDRDLLRALLVKRLKKIHSLSEADARWAVESWTLAIRTLSRSQSSLSAQDSDPRLIRSPDPSNPWPNSALLRYYAHGKLRDRRRHRAEQTPQEGFASRRRHVDARLGHRPMWMNGGSR